MASHYLSTNIVYQIMDKEVLIYKSLFYRVKVLVRHAQVPSKTIFILVSKQEGDKYLHGPGTQGHLVLNEDCLSDEGSENFETLVQPILK